ncbi:Tfp assembly type protein [Sporosarcina sp. GW1-11]|uniref:Tfp assembly type protein n=1 Tax=Sporosarcina sp. GW1-11 TaxID=2899126 RepID=UPI0029536BA3|nr:Tfp assembly type protein [Sporosarcina sp. GW1-11]
MPAIGNIITNSKVSALKADGQNAISAANIYFAESKEPDTSITIDELQEDGYLDDIGGLSGDGTVNKGTGDVTAITISATATNGNISVEFNDASNADINAADNKAGLEGKVTVTR